MSWTCSANRTCVSFSQSITELVLIHCVRGSVQFQQLGITFADQRGEKSSTWLRWRRATHGKKTGRTRIIESEWSRNSKKESVSQGAKDFKFGFELDRMFAHCDMFEGYRATRESMDTEAKLSLPMRTSLHSALISDSDMRHRSGCAKCIVCWQIIYKLRARSAAHFSSHTAMVDGFSKE